jgi:hypothetical protein
LLSSNGLLVRLRGSLLHVSCEQVAGRSAVGPDDLRRFKQIVETGEIVRSDSTPQGHLLANHIKQRPAQPLKEAIR